MVRWGRKKHKSNTKEPKKKKKKQNSVISERNPNDDNNYLRSGADIGSNKKPKQLAL
jgi:hypothetical protein